MNPQDEPDAAHPVPEIKRRIQLLFEKLRYGLNRLFPPKPAVIIAKRNIRKRAAAREGWLRYTPWIVLPLFAAVIWIELSSLNTSLRAVGGFPTLAFANSLRWMDAHPGLASWSQAVGAILIIGVSVWQTGVAQRSGQRALDRQHWMVARLFDEAVKRGETILENLQESGGLDEWRDGMKLDAAEVAEVMGELISHPLERWTSFATRKVASEHLSAWRSFAEEVDRLAATAESSPSLNTLEELVTSADEVREHGRRWRRIAAHYWKR
ncbi:hypothetical protein QO010_001724 [Caulobacter ginsengisoli]|uniref:SMODS and SLOG-associating 2TM effector domain-containing protein n=1 Tax=Caulobacter ginsengisoli TaxID=400775 RepID=A0ABU0IPL8_9CAUL|nr:hypothetical protein [Caulobacter ginsengisoli]MDQ0463953.1 hypothetical protein [Caulobacter ginsengisoli]